MSVLRLKNIAARKGFLIYKEPFKLNIWGIRSRSTVPNRFDDVLHVFFVSDGQPIKKWYHYVFPITTDPGTYWLKNPMHPQGTAMLAPGQYRDTYKIARHRNKYYALCQRLKPVRIIRDYNRDAVLDFNNGRPATGMFGINIHRARKTGTTYTVDNHSAGCQVFKKAMDFNFFMRLCEMHKRVHGNVFTYTLIDHRMEFRTVLKRAAIGILTAGTLAAAYWWLSREQEIAAA
ncbi:MAG: hypothetical protein HUJ25_07650 [Crocinitomicaceae bacterium]|nr:hypothetical protein [Crocinitomicaceae bacterium]